MRPARDLLLELGIDITPSAIVTLNAVGISQLADVLIAQSHHERPEAFSWKDDEFWLSHAPPSERSQYFAVGTAINFRFWRIADSRFEPLVAEIDQKKYKGALFMWRCLRRCVRDQVFPILDARALATITSSDFERIFSDDTGNNQLAVAMADRLANLRDLGRKLLTEWDGHFINLVRASGTSLVAFSRHSRSFRAFDDPVLKLCMVNAILHTGNALVEFDERPVPGIDYHLMRQAIRQRLVDLAPELAAKLRSQVFISAKESYDLRRMVLIALLDLAERAAWPSDLIDNLFWGNRSACDDRNPVCLDALTASVCPFLAGCARITELRTPVEETRYY